MNQNQETLGLYLKREREVRRVPVEEIALRVNAERRLIDALEGDDFDVFDRRSDAALLVKAYAAYCNLDQTEILRRFDTQWKLTGGVKRYPKLTHFAEGDPSPGKTARFAGKRLFAGHVPIRKVRLSFIIGILIVSSLLLYLPDTTQEITPPDASLPGDEAYRVAPSSGDTHPPAAAPGKRKSAPMSISAPDVPRPRAGVSEGKSSLPPKNVRVIGNRDSKRYHLPGMKYYDKVKPYHRVVFQSEREAVGAGYTKSRE